MHMLLLAHSANDDQTPTIDTALHQELEYRQVGFESGGGDTYTSNSKTSGHGCWDRGVNEALWGPRQVTGESRGRRGLVWHDK